MTLAGVSLHLYGPFDLLGYLKKGRLPLLQGDDLLTPYLNTGQKKRQTNAPITDHEIEQEMQRQYQALPSHISQLLTYEAYQKQSDKLMPSILSAIQAKRDAQQGEIISEYSTARIAKVNYLRLFPSAISQFGWQSLADDFSGICVEVDAGHSMFASNDDRLALLKAVSYGTTHDYQVSSTNPIPGFFMDCDEHALRQEWRAAFLFKAKQETLKLASKAVKHIYLSVNASPEDVDAVQRFVSQDIYYRHVGVSLVLPDEQRWRLRISEI